MRIYMVWTLGNITVGEWEFCFLRMSSTLGKLLNISHQERDLKIMATDEEDGHYIAPPGSGIHSFDFCILNNHHIPELKSYQK